MRLWYNATDRFPEGGNSPTEIVRFCSLFVIQYFIFFDLIFNCESMGIEGRLCIICICLVDWLVGLVKGMRLPHIMNEVMNEISLHRFSASQVRVHAAINAATNAFLRWALGSPPGSDVSPALLVGVMEMPKPATDLTLDIASLVSQI